MSTPKKQWYLTPWGISILALIVSVGSCTTSVGSCSVNYGRYQADWAKPEIDVLGVDFIDFALVSITNNGNAKATNLKVKLVGVSENDFSQLKVEPQITFEADWTSENTLEISLGSLASDEKVTISTAFTTSKKYKELTGFTAIITCEEGEIEDIRIAPLLPAKYR